MNDGAAVITYKLGKITIDGAPELIKELFNLTPERFKDLLMYGAIEYCDKHPEFKISDRIHEWNDQI